MATSSQFNHSGESALAARWADLTAPLGQYRRLVRVRLLDEGREVDSFDLASAESLAVALGPVLSPTSVSRLTVRLTGMYEARPPLGIGRTYCEYDLRDLRAAEEFLTQASIDGDPCVCFSPRASDHKSTQA